MISKPWRDRERSFSEVDIDKISIEMSDLSRYFSPKKIHRTKKLQELANKFLTPRQYQIFSLILVGKGITEIAAELGVSKQTINAAIYGSSRNRGGIIRKIKKIVAVTEALL